MLGIPLRLRLSDPSFFKENVFDPISLKLLVNFRVIPSVAVIIEISALIPIAIITKVSMVRNLLPKIARSANRIFSFKFTSHKHKEWFGEMWGHNAVVAWGLGIITFFGRVPLRSRTGCCVAIFASWNRQRISTSPPHAKLGFAWTLSLECNLFSFPWFVSPRTIRTTLTVSFRDDMNRRNFNNETKCPARDCSENPLPILIGKDCSGKPDRAA